MPFQMLVVPVSLAATSARVGRSVVVARGSHQCRRQAAWERLLSPARRGLLSGAYRIGCISWPAFQLLPVGGDAVFSCLRKRERKGEPETGVLILGLWRGFRTGVIAWEHPAEALPTEFSWGSGTGSPTCGVRAASGTVTSTQLVLFKGPASAIPRAQGGIWAGVVSSSCQAEAWIPCAFGLHGSKMKPRIVAGVCGVYFPCGHPAERPRKSKGPRGWGERWARCEWLVLRAWVAWPLSSPHPLLNPRRLVPLSLGYRIALFLGSPKFLLVQDLSCLVSPC